MVLVGAVVVVLVVVFPLTVPIPKVARIDCVLRFTNVSILRFTGVPVVPTIVSDIRTLNDPRSIAHVGSVTGSLLKIATVDSELGIPIPRNASRGVRLHSLFVRLEISNPLKKVTLVIGVAIRTFRYVPSLRRSW